MLNDYRQNEFLVVNEVADVLRIGKSQCYDLVGSPDCPFNVIRIGKLIRIPSNNFFKWYDGLAEKESRKRG